MMNKRRWLALAGVTVLSAGILAACGGGNKSGSGDSEKQTYSYVYVTEPTTLDYIKANSAGTSNVTANVIDGLLENDQYGNLIPSVAEDWTVSEDGLTYTYKLREDAYWYTSDGEEYAQVTAEDFVTGLKHAADEEAEALYVVRDSIKGLSEYLAGDEKDFSKVGVEAVDEFTVRYTLKQAEPFWNSKMTYGILAPVNAEFLESQGDKFGSTNDPSTLLYNGAYLLTASTAKSSIELEKNENYWDEKNVHIDSVKLTFYDGSDPGSLYSGYADGSYSMARLFPTDPSYKKAVKSYGDNVYYMPQNSTTYMLFMNLNRSATKISSKTAEQHEASKLALQNQDFRQALTFALDRKSWNSQGVGEEAATYALRNTLVPPGFVQLGDKEFGDAVTEELKTRGDEWADVDLSDAQDGLYNAEKAKAEFAKAKTALESQGVSFPIQLDLPVDQKDELAVNRAESLKQSVEQSLGQENVTINIHQKSEEEWLAATYDIETAEQADYDLTISGWSPDYQDPSSYLDIFGTKEGAASTFRLGIDHTNTALAEQIGLNEYQSMLDEASAITDDTTKRYEAYAKAQAWLSDQALVVPLISLGGTPRVANEVPFSSAYSWVGIKGESDYIYKYKKLQDKPVTTKEYEAAQKKWEEERAKSNKEYQDSLADHIEK